MINKSIKFSFTAFSQLACQRLSLSAVHNRAQLTKNQISSKFYNNLLISRNYCQIVLLYSRCYLCKLPFSKPIIRHFFGMSMIDQYVNQIQKNLLNDLPSQLFLMKKLGAMFKYPSRNMHSALGLSLSKLNYNANQMKYLTAIQAVNLGYELHNSVQGNFNPNLAIRIGLSVLRKVIKDKYLVLAGDYLHIRGSILASSIGNIELPKSLSQLQIALCKEVHLRSQLKAKIQKQGYASVTVEQIYKISQLRAAMTIHSLKGVSYLHNQPQNVELFTSIGLLVLYRRQLQDFMFNFPRNIHRFLQIKSGNGLFYEQYTISQYLFYHSTQKTGLRMDLAYLNTVELLSNQIKILQSKIQTQLGDSVYSQFSKRISYILMMYS